VRRMVGVLVEIGRGALPPDAIATMLTERLVGAGAADGAGRWTVLEAVLYDEDPKRTPRRYRASSAGRPSRRTPSTRRTTSS